MGGSKIMKLLISYKNLKTGIALLVLLLIILSCTKEEGPAEKSTYGKMKLLKENGDFPQWSPDGNKIAFVQDDQLLVMNSNGSDIIRINDIPCSGLPKWSPSGLEIAFPGADGLYKYKNDGSKMRLTSVMPLRYSWSPDGTEIIYTLSEVGASPGFYIINNDGTNAHKINIPLIYIKQPSFTPSGSKIMFIGSDLYMDKTDIYFIDPDGSNLQKLRLEVQQVSHPQMTKDETRIYLQGTFSFSNKSSIMVMNADGTDQRILIHENFHHPQISPDEKHLAFFSEKNKIWELYMMRTDGSEMTLISNSPLNFRSEGSWSPDSRRYAFYDDLKGVKGIYVVSVNK
jgi:Tol biopolymer transport system component